MEKEEESEIRVKFIMRYIFFVELINGVFISFVYTNPLKIYEQKHKIYNFIIHYSKLTNDNFSSWFKN